MILRVNMIKGVYHIMCPKVGKPVRLDNCHTVLRFNDKIVRCEHYKYLPTKEYLEKRGLGQEYLSGEFTHIVCGYDGPIHEDWEEWGLDPEWGLYRADKIPEEKRKRIIKESGSKPVLAQKKEEISIEDKTELNDTQMRLFVGDKNE